MNITTNCTGCSACANICPQKCIEMCSDNQGFLFPHINLEQCINCGLCKKVCPVLHPPTVSHKTVAFAAKNNNNLERSHSASGGFFPVLAHYVLSQGGTVFGAAWNDDFSVGHISISEPDKLYMLQSAKYSQSYLYGSFQEIRHRLKAGKMVLFSGTPCQCAGLKSYLDVEYENLITVDLICHGMPSSKVWQYYIDRRSRLENNGVRPQKINLRSKVTGWSHYSYSIEFDYGNQKKTYIPNGEDIFMKAFTGNICLRNSCSACQVKGVDRCTDFTLGDYWGIWDQYPHFDDNQGTSLVLIHSKKGQFILNQLKSQVTLLPVDLETSYIQNPSLIQSVCPHKEREAFLSQVNTDNFAHLISSAFSPPRSTGRFYQIKAMLHCFINKVRLSK